MVAELDATGVDDVAPVLSADGLTLYFARRVNDPSLDELYFTTRAAVDQPFAPPVGVPELNTSDEHVRPNWTSPDGCRLYHQRAGRGASIWSIYVASKRAG